MKAKTYLSILSALLLAGMPIKAQVPDDVYLDNDATGKTVINNYYGDYDYFYASRINRFHRSYAVFDYYSPLFTDIYWYTYQPVSWGISIYGVYAGFGIDFCWPVYYTDYYPWYYGWNNLFVYRPAYWFYEPYYPNYWYTPFAINHFAWDRWNYRHHGLDWDRGYYRDNYFRNDYRYGYYSHNDRSGRKNSSLSTRYNGTSGRYTAGNYDGRRRDAGSAPVINRDRPQTQISYRNSVRRIAGTSAAPARAENRYNSTTVSSSGRNASRNIQKSPVNTDLRRSSNAGISSVNRKSYVQKAETRSTPNMNFIAGADRRNMNSQAGSYRSSVARPDAVRMPAGNQGKVQQSAPVTGSGNIVRTNTAGENRVFKYSGDSPAGRRSFSGGSANTGRARPLSSIQNRTASVGRREIAAQSQTRSRIAPSSGSSHSSRSNSGENGRRR